MYGIPPFLYRLYSKSSLSSKIYTRLRWQLCSFKEIEKLVPRKRRILDIGCGVGLLTNYLALTSEDREVLGVDFSKKKIHFAKQTIGQRKNINFIAADVRDIDPVDYDVVVMTDFLHHVSFEEQERLLRNIFLKLKNSDRLILQDIDAGKLCRCFLIKALDKVSNPGKPLFYRNKDSWQNFLQQLGFNIKVFSINMLFVPEVLFICDKK